MSVSFVFDLNIIFSELEYLHKLEKQIIIHKYLFSNTAYNKLFNQQQKIISKIKNKLNFNLSWSEIKHNIGISSILITFNNFSDKKDFMNVNI